MAQELNFTKTALAALPPAPDGKRVYYRDTKTNALQLQVTAKGAKTFYVYRWVQGRPERIRIGAFPDMTVERARKEAQQVNGQIAAGQNPNDARRAVREEMTLQDLFDLYMKRHAKVHKTSWAEDQAQFDRYLSGWKDRKLSRIRKADIQALHAKIGADVGTYAANRLLALLHTVYNKAADWGWEKANPAHGIKKFKEKARERFIQADEIPAFFQALSEEANDSMRDFFLLSLLTGARRDNVQSMRWDQVNIERGTWEIPKTKNGDSHTVPLVPEALEILEERRKAAEAQDEDGQKPVWVFPGPGATGHLAEPKTAWRRILRRMAVALLQAREPQNPVDPEQKRSPAQWEELLQRAGVQGLRVHDLRRSLGSWQAATGVSLSIIGKTLAHRNVSTTAIYARLNLDPVRESMQTATRAMFDAAKVKPAGEVVPLKRVK
jgi:integrase